MVSRTARVGDPGQRLRSPPQRRWVQGHCVWIPEQRPTGSRTAPVRCRTVPVRRGLHNSALENGAWELQNSSCGSQNSACALQNSVCGLQNHGWIQNSVCVFHQCLAVSVRSHPEPMTRLSMDNLTSVNNPCEAKG